MKRSIIILLGLFTVLSAAAQTLTVDQVREDKLLATGNYLDLFHLRSDPHTRAPRGFKPVYLSSYTRHGARLFSRNELYDNAFRLLVTAEQQDMLTPGGQEFLRRFREFYPLVQGREYDLTTIGQEQHRQHAHRLYRQYRRLFRGRRHIDARSTQITRTILSMTAFTEEIKGINPRLRITTSSSPVDMGVLNPTSRFNPRAEQRDYSATLEAPEAPWQGDYRRLWEDRSHPKEFFGQLFRDWKYVLNVYPDAVEAEKMFFFIIADAQCATGGTGPFLDFVSPEELYAMWECENFRIYNIAGLSECFGGRPWALSEVLLRDMISYTESDLAGRSVPGPYPDPADVRLRYGHDFKLSALMTLMDADGWNTTVSDPDRVKDVYNFSRLPMASSIEWVLYRNRKGDTLIKVVMNDNEIQLPIQSFSGPYYRWEDFKAHCEARLVMADNILDTK